MKLRNTLIHSGMAFSILAGSFLAVSSPAGAASTQTRREAQKEANTKAMAVATDATYIAFASGRLPQPADLRAALSETTGVSASPGSSYSGSLFIVDYHVREGRFILQSCVQFPVHLGGNPRAVRCS